MYVKGLSAINAATGVALLPETGNSRTLFTVAATLLASGVVIFAVSFAMGLRAKHVAAK